ncbi:MAG: right-handed parallel beta-helix repeat-containing protein [Bacteroidota bacterium]|nr:right-handed parallel beta-helix repeat-containing protein [Bacteroidota bacterium]
MKTTQIILFTLCFLVFGFSSKAASVSVPTTVDWIKQVNTAPLGSAIQKYNTLEVNLQAGDSLLLIGGTRNPLRIDNLRGDSLYPIVICNKDAKVIISKPVGGYYGISFSACRYIKLSGRNNPNLAYGIHVTQLPAGSAISINYFSSNFEVEGIEISRVQSSGIVAKTDATCANLQQFSSFVLYDLRLHHNFIHHVGNEGFYIGNTGYNNGAGSRLVCSAINFNDFLLPHPIRHVRIYENVVDSIGWDGIQVAAATDVEIFDNFISNDSYADVAGQQSGIFIGQPSQAKVYRNYIQNGKGSGIQCFGVGTQIYNNLIVNPANSLQVRGTFNSSGQLTGSTFSYGIYINDKVCLDTTVPKLPYLVAHNTIVIPKIYRVGSPYNTWAPQGINANSLNYIFGSYLVNNLVVIDSNVNNIIAAPINGIYASNSVPNYSTALAPSFISINNKSTYGNNFYSNEITAVHFQNWLNQQYSLQSFSSAVDAGVGSVVSSQAFLQKDIFRNNRPQGMAPDFGAIETGVSSPSNNQILLSISPNPLSLSQAITTLELSITDTLTSGLELSLNSTQFAQSMPLPIQEMQVLNGKIQLSILRSNLPVNPGVYSVQAKRNGTLIAFANLLLLP